MYLINRFILSIAFVIISLLISENLINKRSSKSNIYKVILITIFAFIIFLSFTIIEILFQLLIIILILSILIKRIYEVKFSISIACSITILILFTIPKLLDYFVITNNLKYIILIIYIIVLIPFIKNVLRKFIQKIQDDNTEVLSLVFLISSFLFFYFIIFFNRNVSVNKIIITILIIFLCILYIIHVYDKNKYYNLIKKYNSLLDYSYSYEEELEKDCLIRHEHKNQLAVIKGMIDDPKTIEYINDIIKSYKNEENVFIKGLNILPNGGIRGLIYYKICTMKKNKINYSIEISKNIKKYFQEINANQKKILTYIIGIFLDNAIEECEGIKESIISVEMYYLENKINIIISNTLRNKVKLNRIGEKGYSKKGNNRGNGIFLIKKLLKQNKEISIRTKIINNYFVQDIKIEVNAQ